MAGRSRAFLQVLERWVREHHASTYRAAYRVVQDEGLAMDVAQRTFQRALERGADQVDDPRRLLCWLATRIGLQELRAARSRRTRETAFARSQALDAAARESAARATARLGASRSTRQMEASMSPTIEDREERAAVARCVADLPDDLRIPLELRFAEEMTFSSIAALMECSEPTAHDRVRRGLERLRAGLKRSGFAVAFVRLEDHLAAPSSVPTPPGLESALLKAAAPAVISTKVLMSVALMLASAATLVSVGSGPPPRSEPEHGERVASAIVDAVSPAAPGLHSDPVRREVAASSPDGSQRRAMLGAPAPIAPGQRHFDGPGEASEVAHAIVRGTVSGPNTDLRGFLEAHASGAEVGKATEPLATAAVSDAGTFLLSVPIRSTNVRYVTVHLIYAGSRVTSGDELRLEPGDDRTIDLALEHDVGERVGAYSLDLAVQDVLGRPVKDAFVRVSRAIRTQPDGMRYPEEDHGTTDAIGRVRIDGSRLGAKQIQIFTSARSIEPTSRHELVIDATGHHAHTLHLDMPGTGVDLLAPSHFGAVIEPTAADPPSVSGRMIDAATGESIFSSYPEVDLIPVPDDLSLHAYRADFLPNHLRQSPRQQIDVGGTPSATDRFKSTAWQLGRTVAIGWARDRAPAIFGPFDLRVTPQIDDAVLQFTKEAIAEGVVMRADGTPLPDAVIMITGTGEISEQAIADADLQMRKSGGEGFLVFAAARTSSEGRFKIDRLPDNLPVRLVALYPTYHSTRSPILSLRAGETTSALELRMQVLRER